MGLHHSSLCSVALVHFENNCNCITHLFIFIYLLGYRVIISASVVKSKEDVQNKMCQKSNSRLQIHRADS